MLNDSMLTINESTIHIDDISVIQAVTKKSIQNGIILSVVGAGFITLGTVFAIQSGNAEGIGAPVKVLLSILTYFAANNSLYLMIKNFFWGNDHRTDSGWTLKMKNDASVIIPSGKLP